MILANVNTLRAITITVIINTSWVHTTSLTTKISYISLSKSIRAVLIMMVCKKNFDLRHNAKRSLALMGSLKFVLYCWADVYSKRQTSLKSSPLWRIVWFSFCFSAQHTAVTGRTHPINYWWAADTAECLARARLPLGVDAHIVTVTARITVIGFFFGPSSWQPCSRVGPRRNEALVFREDFLSFVHPVTWRVFLKVSVKRGQAGHYNLTLGYPTDVGTTFSSHINNSCCFV